VYLESKSVAVAFAVVMVFCLVGAVLYGVLTYSSSGKQELEATPTMVQATPLPTPPPTPKPDPGVSSINFTRWHPSTTGENIVKIAYPTNHSVVKTSDMPLEIYAASKSELWAINSIWYTADWLKDARQCFSSFDNLYTDNIFVTINFQDIPQGNHTFTAYLSVHDNSKANVTVCFTTQTDYCESTSCVFAQTLMLKSIAAQSAGCCCV
jgi:hypothetical protein